MKGYWAVRCLARAHWGEYLPGWHPWEDYRGSYSARTDLGGGVVLTLSHPLDYLRWFFGDVQVLWAFAGQVSPLELAVDDYAEIGMQFANNFHASLHLNYYQRPAQHHFEIVCAEGTLQWDNASGAGRIYQASVGEWQPLLPPEGFERNDLFLDELRHFLDVIEGIAEPACSLADGKAALVLAQAALESAKAGRIVQISG